MEDFVDEFVKAYYDVFDGEDRTDICSFYRDGSYMTYTGTSLEGPKEIKHHLEETVQYKTIEHHVSNCDGQPSVGDGVNILVTGHVVMDDDDDTPLAFAEFFHLLEDDDGEWFITNSVFSLTI
ncbi:hypothetical protein PCE1_000229 [Barthelona sp. PCE]